MTHARSSDAQARDEQWLERRRGARAILVACLFLAPLPWWAPSARVRAQSAGCDLDEARAHVATSRSLSTPAVAEMVECMEARLRRERGSRTPSGDEMWAFPPEGEVVRAAMDALLEARAIYAARVDADARTRARLQLENARVFAHRGRDGEARSLFTQVLEQPCTGPDASPVSRDAYRGLVELALARGDGAELARLDRTIEARACTFDSVHRWSSTRLVERARLDEARSSVDRLERTLTVAPGRQPSVQAYVHAIRAQLDRNASELRAATALLAELLVTPARLEALVLQGRVYEAGARAIEEADLEPPPDSVLRHTGGPVYPRFPVRIRQILDEQARPLRCLALARYAQALMDAEMLGLGDPALAVARARLRVADEATLGGCLARRPPLLRAAVAARARPEPGLAIDGGSNGALPALAP